LRKRICDDCKRKKIELAEKRLMESWLCFFDENVFCPFSKVPKDRRVASVCHSCKHYARFMREMEEEDDRVMDEIDGIRRNPEKYGYSRRDFHGVV